MKRSIKIGATSYDISSDDAYLRDMPPEFEPDMVDLFASLITPQMVVADVGANIGMTALLFSDLARKVYAFEPSPSTFALLSENLAAAGKSNIELCNLGLGDQPQSQTITFSNNNRSGGFVSQHIQPVVGYTTENIEISTLDWFFSAKDQRPDFIKMDVEGFEPHVIRGGRSLLAAQKPVVVLELNHFCLNVLQRVTLPDFFDLLRSVFPVLIAVNQGNLLMADLHNADMAYNVMHAHVTRFAFPNIVAGFDPALVGKLAALAQKAQAGV